MRRTLIRAAAIVVGSMLAGLTVNAVRPDTNQDGQPRKLAWITPPKPVLEIKSQVSVEDAEASWNAGLATFLDARAPSDYVAGHIALAHNLPAEEFEKYYPEIATFLTPESEVVVYCDGEQCELSHELRAQLNRLGYRNVRVLVNGWTVWRTANLPTSVGDRP